MIQRIKSQLMTRVYNKQTELREKWTGPVCPKIRKKLLKNSEAANICYVWPAGKGIFQVQERDHEYIVEIGTKHCDCRRWDLTGIPCNHAVACLRHERIPAEDLLPACYSVQTYANVYGFNIMPCADKTSWEKQNGPEVLPPVYEKKVGRPPKSRRKQPHEIQGTNGPKMSRHGVIIHCSWCKNPDHNAGGCAYKKAGVKPPQDIPIPIVEQGVAGQEHIPQDPVVTQVKLYPTLTCSYIALTSISNFVGDGPTTPKNCAGH